MTAFSFDSIDCQVNVCQVERLIGHLTLFVTLFSSLSSCFASNRILSKIHANRYRNDKLRSNIADTFEFVIFDKSRSLISTKSRSLRNSDIDSFERQIKFMRHTRFQGLSGIRGVRIKIIGRFARRLNARSSLGRYAHLKLEHVAFVERIRASRSIENNIGVHLVQSFAQSTRLT